MGQQEVLEYFKKHKDEWLTTRDIHPHIDSNMHSLTCALKKLRDYKSIRYKEILTVNKINNLQRLFIYKYKR